ncbi:COP1-interacting protein 7-like isoform X1 [Phoenix dactylifera]|uniref:COP1-interacting protein 7-like isoform X1 n=1 Tax=Phoenix dactylifera TaxID=42345 RepID=A0A8B9AQ32_PHODC|nr:COP1-interacting protein 7-like isoform X1 [Phoenix dactylifera]XP_008793400.2 COP1-interacting protein 7-like isoform X1 [Phoenix dactylifera]XP_008793401.2 COP1-interacting protein 7-like isoform X1 [Phoenix dactylifera]XP_038988881.1 COP1-interacting protein 7-like isoform X1 [Phoenix dactylifera]XP_038988882.1 COP1-interacting protein 7-like isoform X1 [Phoenix dactylifera]
MEGEITANTVLDYAVFRISSNQNRYEALVCSKGNTEKLASGPLDQLALHLPEAKGCQSKSSSQSFQLQPVESLKGSSWFTKSTLGRFLHIVNLPEMLKSVNAIENEMSQLEDTRRFHLSLYVKDHPGSQTADGCLDEVGLTQKINVETMSSDATKNELLRAINLRFTVLREELAASFDRAAGTTLSIKQISDLEAFARHFQAVDLRNSLLKYLAIIPKDQLSEPTVEQTTHSEDTTNNCEDITGAICQPSQQIDITKPFSDGASPAKIAQAERQGSTESEESSDSSDEDRTCVERSRPLIRSASPRRSASPMRRIQIGRSGSRRSTALTIKSLSYFPVRERIPFNRDADRNNSEDESDQPQRKSDNTVGRISVQDAINLFESRQKDQNLDIQRRASGVSISTNKSVLRRWSAGMGNSFNHSSQQSATNTGSQNTSIDLATEAEEKKLTEVKVESNFSESLNPDENPQDREPSEVVKMASPPKNNPSDLVKSQPEEISDRAAASAEWNQHKEAELNQMLMKMMESKPGRYQETTTCTVGYQDVACEQRGGLCSQYKEKRDEKRRAENAGKSAAREGQFKVMQETLEQSKAVMASKAGGIIGKHDSSNSQRPRRNLSSSPVLVKKEVSKPAGPRKASPKSSPLPTSRNSRSSGSSLKANASQPTKTSPRMIPSNTTPNRRKPQSTPLQTQPSPKTERLVQKGRKGSPADAKPIMKSQEEKKKAMTKTTKVAKARSPAATGDVSHCISAKPSFYNKVTKKSSVVPLESKPFLRKGTGIGPGTGSATIKTKVSLSDDSAKNSGNLTQTEEKESAPLTDESTTRVLELDLAQPANDVDASLENSLDSDLILEKTENSKQILAVLDNGFQSPVEPPAPEIEPDEDMGISSAAWVEVEHQEVSAKWDNDMSEISASPGLAPVTSSSPRVHHSLSQMLQADSSEPEIIEWGNAENPPAFVYQKDAPKGLKRLLKFARKSKEANATGWASPSVFSEGEDDPEEPKAANKKNLDSLSRKAGLGKGYGQLKTMLGESLDGGNSSRRTADFLGMHDILSAQSSARSFTSLRSDKSREGHVPVTATSTKASRSFFSLSTFRSSKSSETKPR